jgi:hypothetical protein
MTSKESKAYREIGRVEYLRTMDMEETMNKNNIDAEPFREFDRGCNRDTRELIEQ